jgi:DNA-binding transcriptional LysR family regulator
MLDPLPEQHGNVELLFDDRHVLVVAANSPWARKRNLTLAQLIGEPWVLPAPDTTVGEYIVDAFRAAGIEPPRASVLTFSLPLHRRLLATGRYLTALPLSMLHYGATSLRRLAVKFPARPRPVGVMTLKNRTLSPLAERFIDCAREVAKPLARA